MVYRLSHVVLFKHDVLCVNDIFCKYFKNIFARISLNKVILSTNLNLVLNKRHSIWLAVLRNFVKEKSLRYEWRERSWARNKKCKIGQYLFLHIKLATFTWLPGIQVIILFNINLNIFEVHNMSSLCNIILINDIFQV